MCVRVYMLVGCLVDERDLCDRMFNHVQLQRFRQSKCASDSFRAKNVGLESSFLIIITN